MTTLAPILLFGYNRPIHIKRCLESLQRNDLAQESVLFVYIDKVRDNDLENNRKNNEVINIVESDQWCGEVRVILREENYGIERNTIEGVHEILAQFGKVIVLEDDLILSNSFLRYMNIGLSKYESEESVKQICGCNLLSTLPSEMDAIFLPITSSWGWGTWKRVWDEVDFSPRKWPLTTKESFLFDIEGVYPYSRMLKSQFLKNKKNTWDILFWNDVFRKRGLVLYPKKNLITNAGFDGTGTHYTKDIKAKKLTKFDDVGFELFKAELTFNSSDLRQLKTTLLTMNLPFWGRMKSRIFYFFRWIRNYGISLKEYYGQ
jgi:hypothetical protein